MIHKIKALYDEGQGLSIRAIAKELGISRNTVRKYLQLDEASIGARLDDPSRLKKLDEHRDLVIHLLKAFPKLSAVKLGRKLREALGDLDVSARSLRRYTQALKREIASGQLRYYEPVVDMVPGVQIQVDPGELRNVLIGGVERAVHFVVFVLAYSRLMYVGVSFRPLDTGTFIQLHDEALRYFGGVTQECVYDQTKLVVLSEQYREVTLNQRFHQYATTAGFRIHACQGYDPESKGKVEAGVKYVKQDCFYGEAFADEAAVREHVHHWLETVANVRVHGTTGRLPREHFEAEERARLQPYLTPVGLLSDGGERQTRRVDKTGLISWRANKYSVPMAWQQATVGVRHDGNELLILDCETDAVIARHAVCGEKGRIIKNNHHYRDQEQRIADLEDRLTRQLGDELGPSLCAVLQRTSPRIYKDQLTAVCGLLGHQGDLDHALLHRLAMRPQLTATTFKQVLEAHQQAQARGRQPDERSESGFVASKGLRAYAPLGRSNGQEVTHEPA